MWRPEDWEYGAWQKDERFLRNPPVIVEERLYNAFEAGADALLAALEKGGRLLSEKEVEYRRIGGIMRRAREAKNKRGDVIISPDEENTR